MRRVLVLGGYGGFGARISARLAEAGVETLVAGRSLEKALAFCAGRPRLIPIAVNREHDLRKALAIHAPFALIDAAGPFQGLSCDTARACIAAGRHDLYIADGRAFVSGVRALDVEARARGFVSSLALQAFRRCLTRSSGSSRPACRKSDPSR